ncbi:hypothetical protein [Aureispira anguillae]|uniref:Uncharacterized protein n=1 Tax=Aureispira anguillae TaxID=2864201 RepID=A0A915YFT1_9BACT|nr:hypothetical protein [Aureispira anguillae]BDS12347.1 hypothetical protein AsAng_0030680 [Aureispira anguillae]
METTAVAPKLKKGPSSRLIVLLFVLLIGGGIGIYFWVRPKKDADDEKKESTPSEKIPGRTDSSTHKPSLTPDQIAAIFGNSGGTTPPPDQDPLYYNSPQAQDLIRAEAQRLQAREEYMDIFRAKYNIGHALIRFNNDAQHAIDQMMAKLNGVDIVSRPTTRHLTFPIYGTYEPIGKSLRSELQNLLNRGYKGLNLTHLRDKEAPWWIESIELNLLVGTTNAFVPTPFEIWSEFGFRPELDHYKGMNGHWVRDQYLTKIVDHGGTIEIHAWDVGAKAAYPAGTLYTFVQRWVEAIDHLDKITEWEALRYLQEKKGWVFTFIDPETGVDHSATVDPSRDPDIDFFEDNGDSSGGKKDKLNQ